MLITPSSRSAFEHLKNKFNEHAEEVWVIGLDTQLKLKFEEMLFRGTMISCPAHPRDIFRSLIINNAYAYILAHNHPSKNLLPSPSDIQLTQKLFRLSKMMEIPLIDHIIFSSENYFSFTETYGKLSPTKLIQRKA